MPVRAFIAIELPVRIRQRLDDIQRQIRSVMGFKAIWVKPDAMHVTIKFLGSIEEERLDALVGQLSNVSFEPFSVNVGHLGGFPSLQRPRVLWVGTGASPALTALHARIDETAEELGFPPDDHDFTGHITLARFKETPRLSEPIRRLISDIRVSERVEVGVFTLFRSTLTSKGPIYTALRRFPARAAGVLN